MANRDNHYEAAFEEFLRGRGMPYIAVDEAKRSLLGDGASIKSLDFIVSRRTDIPVCHPTVCHPTVCHPTVLLHPTVCHPTVCHPTVCHPTVCHPTDIPVRHSTDKNVCPPVPAMWLVDVKGRRFPSGDVQKQYWKNWSTRDDLRSLAQWEELFGVNFRGLFVFAYDVLGDRAPLRAEELFRFRGSLYGFVAVPLADYARQAHPISPKWDTWAMPAAQFRRCARPLAELLGLAKN